MKISSDSYEKLIEQYTNAYDWIMGMGLNVENGRLASYLKIITLLVNTYKTASEEELKNIYPDTVNAMYEIMAIISIHNALGSVPLNEISGIKSKFKKSITGPYKVASETHKSNSARNYLFELLVMARLHNPQREIYVDFMSVTDTGVKFLKKKYLIECKRLQSENKIEANIRDASKQLDKALKSKIGSNHRGLISIDISKIFNPEFKLLIKENDKELLNHINLIMDKFIKEYSHIWQNILKTKNKKIVGVLVRVSFMGVSEERNLLSSCVQWVLNPKIGISETDRISLKNMAETLNPI